MKVPNEGITSLISHFNFSVSSTFLSSFCADDGHCLHEIIYMPTFSSSPFPRAFPTFFLAGMYAQ